MPQPPKPLRPGRSARDWSGAELRHWRTLRKLTQDQLGALVHVSGDLIAKLEKATRPCSPALAEALDAALDTGGVLSRHLELVTAEAARGKPEADNTPTEADSPAAAARNPGPHSHASGILPPSEQRPADPYGDGRTEGGTAHTTTDELVRVPCRTADGRIIFVAMPRRALLRGGVSGAALLALTPGPAVTRGSAHVPSADPVRHLRRMRRALVDCDNVLGPGHVLATVRDHIHLIQRLRAEAPGGLQRPLLQAQSEYAEFCGWLYQDTGDHARAQYWTDRALDWSHAVGDDELTAYVMARKAQLAGDMREAVEALDLAEAVQRLAAPHRRLRAMGILYGAHGHALRGEGLACRRSYDTVLELLSDPREESERRRGGWLDPAYVELHRAHSLSLLGEHREAAAMFETAIHSLPPAYRRDRGVYLTRSAVAHACGGEPEQAAAAGLAALPIAAETGSARVFHEMALLDARLAQWSTVPEVIEFRDALDGIVVREV
ncbi:helix-turn-helix domain-containing protein [Streptantibioticus parmotrematis]|uniref:helix-turn-helix domain-containing protein n=1 Tax=Streptantibioticus parmotrematis TaxID=2873249 RepID=UPI00340B291C